jgi:hypothetical protein
MMPPRRLSPNVCIQTKVYPKPPIKTNFHSNNHPLKPSPPSLKLQRTQPLTTFQKFNYSRPTYPPPQQVPVKAVEVTTNLTPTHLHHLHRKSTRVKLSSTKSKFKIGMKQKKMNPRLRRAS